MPFPTHNPPMPPPLPGRLHGLVVVVGGGSRVLLLPLPLHGPLGRPHSCLLRCLLDVRVLPGSGRPLLLSLAHAAAAATVEVMDLRQTYKERVMNMT